MLRFSQPSRLGQCLKETYEYLLPALGNALGYPPGLQSFSAKASPKGATAW